MAVKKTLWHGELRDMGQVEVEVKQEARHSTYSGKPDYVEIIVGGNLRQYQVEAPQCADVFKGRVGQKLLIEARDSRENATIHLMGPARGQSAPQPQQRTDTRPQQSPTTTQPPADTRQASAPAPETRRPESAPAPKKTREEIEAEHLAKNQDAVNTARKFANKKVNAFEIAFRAVDHLAERRAKSGRAITPEQFQGIVTSVFISMDRAGLSDTLPTGDLDKYLPAEQPKQ